MNILNIRRCVVWSFFFTSSVIVLLGFDVVLETTFVFVECSCRPCAVVAVVMSSSMVVVCLGGAADGTDVVDIGEVRAGAVLDKSDSVVTAQRFHDVLRQ